MAVVLTISGVDRSSFVVWNSLRIDNILTKQVDRCSFKIRNTHGFVPQVGREVIITDNGTRVFGGIIVRRSQESPAFGIIEFLIECTDYTRALDQHLVAEVYNNTSIEDIIADLLANWAPAGFTGTQVDAPTIIDAIQFKYEPVSTCLEQLANIVGADWYVDYYKDLFFKDPAVNSAPVDIEDGNGTYANDTLVIRRDNSQVRNSIIVRGGEYLGTEFTASVRMDGKQITVPLPYRYQDFKATLTGHPLNLGIDYIDSPDAHDALYNFEEKILRFKESDRPNQNATLSFAGKPYLPVIVKVKDQTAINSIFSAEQQGDGRYEYLVTDKSITSKQAARDRAYAEIRTYGETLSEGEFETETSGLRAGQQIRINSVARNVDEFFVINKVTSVCKTPTDGMYYRISLITTKTMNFISIMKKLLLAETKKIEINANEVLDLVEAANEVINIEDQITTSVVHNPQAEVINIADSVTAQTPNYAPVYVLGPQAPSLTKRQFILNGSKLG